MPFIGIDFVPGSSTSAQGVAARAGPGTACPWRLAANPEHMSTQDQPPLASPDRGCTKREGASEAAPGAVGQAVGGGCQSGWGKEIILSSNSPWGFCPFHHPDSPKGPKRLGAVTVGYKCH